MACKGFCDGGSRGNPGPAAYGYVLKDEAGSVIAAGRGYLGIETNNVAEYRGLQALLTVAMARGIRELDVFADSMLMVCQVNGTWKTKNTELKMLKDNIQFLMRQFGIATISHVYRTENKEADRLVNLALDSVGTSIENSKRDKGL